MISCDQYDSPVGTLWLTGQEGVLMGLSFEEPRGEFLPGDFAAARSWLDDYFQGISREIDFQTDISGTSFQRLIWNLLLKIPFGKTCTYGDLAKQAAGYMGKDKMSAQAVGQAVGHNPIAVIIPCHRVVGAGGKLTGYAYGLEKKQWLLNHEQNRR